MFNQITGGHPSPYLALSNDLVHREYLLLILLIIPVFLLGVIPSILTSPLSIPSLN
jgi:NADH:ubiquinone oxidoreductase subunit 4 (subunit M)